MIVSAAIRISLPVTARFVPESCSVCVFLMPSPDPVPDPPAVLSEMVPPSFAVFPEISPLLNVKLPLFKIPPPSKMAVFPEMVPPSMVSYWYQS